MNQQDTIAYFPNSLDSNGAHLTSRQQAANGGARTPVSFSHHNGGGLNAVEQFMPSGSAPTQFISASNSTSPTTAFHHHNAVVVNGGASSSAAAGNTTTTVFVTNDNHENPSAHLHSSHQVPTQSQQRIALQFAGGNSPMTMGSGGQPQHIIIAAPPNLNDSSGDEKPSIGGRGAPPATFVEYYIEQQPGCSSANSGGGGVSPTTMQTAVRYGPGRGVRTGNATVKAEREMMKKARQAEAARQRYHRLSPDEKKALNVRRTVAQKRKRQREKELAELEQILRQSDDIFDDPEVIEQLREKRMRAKWAEAARNRYQKMSEADRRVHNSKRKARQTGPKPGEKADPAVVESASVSNLDSSREQRLSEQNKRKAEAARQRYHRMSTEEKKLYNARRTEAFRRRRMEEEALLAMPIGRINGEALERAQQIVVRNAKRAEAARLRYQRMTPEQRKTYNQKRYTPKRRMIILPDGSAGEIVDVVSNSSVVSKLDVSKVEFDALTSLERDVVKRTHQAQQALVKQRQTTTATMGIPTLIPITSLSGQHPQMQLPQGVVSQGQHPTQTIQIIHPGGAQQMLGGGATTNQPQLLSTRHMNQPHSIQVQYITAAGGGGGAPGTIVSTAPHTTPPHLISYRGAGRAPQQQQ